MADTRVKLTQEFSSALSRKDRGTAREQWKDHLDHTLGGAGGKIYDIADKVQSVAAAAALPSLGTLTVPLAGPFIAAAVEGFEWTAYGLSSLTKAGIRHLAINRATDSVGGNEKDRLSLADGLGHGLKSLVPNVIGKYIGLC